MRNSILAAVAAAAALFIGVQGADAKILKFWDADQQKFLVYDSDNPHPGGGQAYTPILRETVKYDGPYGPDTIIINTSERRLYFVTGDGEALKYGIGVGREGFTWQGTDHISRKAEWPGWTPPAVMIAREAAKGRRLPGYMKGGIGNPLGARALYIGARIGFLRLHPSRQRRRHRPLRSRRNRHKGRRSELRGAPSGHEGAGGQPLVPLSLCT